MRRLYSSQLSTLIISLVEGRVTFFVPSHSERCSAYKYFYVSPVPSDNYSVPSGSGASKVIRLYFKDFARAPKVQVSLAAQPKQQSGRGKVESQRLTNGVFRELINL